MISNIKQRVTIWSLTLALIVIQYKKINAALKNLISLKVTIIISETS